MKTITKYFTANGMSSIWLIGLLLLSSVMDTSGQVNFPQTSDYDFYRGVFNGIACSGDNIYLENAADSSNNWLTTTVLPQTLSGHKTATWNNRYVYLVGGFNNSTYSNAVYYSSLNSGGVSGWSGLNPLPVGLKDPAVVIGTNTIYVLGGRDATQVFSTIYYASINWDGTIGSWQTSSVSLPSPRWGHTAVYLNGYIYVVGGSDVTTINSAVNSVYYAKVKADNTITSFLNGVSLPLTRNKHSMVAYNGNVYVLGGYDNTGAKSANVYYMTPGTDGFTGSWSDATPLPQPISNHSSVVSNGLIMVLAGATNSTLSNTAYYAKIDQIMPWTWKSSIYPMYDFTKDGSAFAVNGMVIHCGGINLSGTPIVNSRYTNLAMTSNYIHHGNFVSMPFYELGADRIIDSLTFHATYDPAFANCQVAYRTAHNDGDWTDWVPLSSTSPIAVNDTTQYLQYSVVLTGQSTYNSVFHDLTLSTRGTQLCGNLNGISTFTQALSPYWVTCDISFTGGTHTFEAGTTILFLPNTGMTVGQANIICNGTSTDSVKFMYYTSEKGLWNGIYFDPNSDIGVSSQFNYTIIDGAGNGGNNANLNCNQTSEPILNRCNIRGAIGNGIYMYYCYLSIQNTVVKENSENGIYLDYSSPTFISCALSYNGGAGVYLTNNSSLPTYTATTIDHNLYGFHYPSPNFSFSEPAGSPTLLDNTYNGVAFDGGDITSSQTWNTIFYDYFLLGTVRIYQYGTSARLTIEPGNTIKACSGVQIKVGEYTGCWWCGAVGGELYAIGTPDSLIAFTSYNGLPGGWGGIYFSDYSDNNGGQSHLENCVIENGNDFNIYSEATCQPNSITNCIIRNAIGDGIRLNSTGCTNIITNCTINNNGGYPVKIMDPNYIPFVQGNSYSGNVKQYIALYGESIQYNETIYFDGLPYHVLGNLSLYGSPRLTIKPGVTLAFAPGKHFRLGENWDWRGSIWAEGKADSIITFKPFNDSIGGWGGMRFYDGTDYNGATSLMKYCKIEKSASNNLFCENANQPYLNHCEFAYSGGVNLQLNASNLTLDSCIIRNAGANGLVGYPIEGAIHHCQFLNNNGYPIYYTQAGIEPNLTGCTFTGNTINFLALQGGDYWESKTLRNYGIGYHILDNIRILKNNDHSRLTIQPGLTLAFNPGKYLQVGENSSYGGELYAIGTPDSVITFKPINEQVGGWNGIYFNNYNDDYGGTSKLKYCTVKKGSDYNIYVNGSQQPELDHCTIDSAYNIGLKNSGGEPLSVKNCLISHSGGNGIYAPTFAMNIENCIISNNGSVGINVSQSTGSIINSQFSNNSGYPLWYNDWTCNTYLHGNIYSGNNPNYIALSGGDYSGNRRIINDGIPYHVVGNIRVFRYYTDGFCPKLSIDPGTTLKFDKGKYLQIAPDCWCYKGQLVAEGKPDSIISFVPFNDSIGGWGGLYFYDGSDQTGCSSSMKYCKIEKSASNNLFCENANQPYLNHCEFAYSGGVNLQLNASNLTIDSCIIRNAGANGLVGYPIEGPIHHCQFLNNNGYPIYYTQAGIEPNLTGCTFSGNTINYLALQGGDYWESKTLRHYGIGYHILDNIRILKNNDHSRLTIQPGLTLAFNPGKNLQVGENSSYGGELYAQGTPDSIITFMPINGQIGGWNGIYFNNYSDEYGSTSSLQYCKIEKGNNYNLYCESSNQPQIKNCEFKKSLGINLVFSSSSPAMESTVIDSAGTIGMQLNNSNPQIIKCTFNNSGTIGIQSNSSAPTIDSCLINNSGSNGMEFYASGGSIQNTRFENNNGYPLKFSDWSCYTYLKKNKYPVNLLNFIALSGGDYSDNRTLYYDSIPYHVLNDLKVKRETWYSLPALTIRPGITLAFAQGKSLQIAPDYYYNNGRLLAEGKQDSIITFKPFNDSIGGWGGISFYDGNDNWGGTSFMRYCRVEKGANYNLYCESSNQPTIENCIFLQSSGNGLRLNSSVLPQIKKTSFVNNVLNGIFLEGSSYPTIGNDTSSTNNLFGNGNYALYNNTGYNIDARYNYWGSCDSAMIATHIYDKSDNGGLGRVYFNPFACVPSLNTNLTAMSGTLKYDNSLLSPMNNATLLIKNFAGNTIASTTTNGSGGYSFAPFPSGNYKMFITPSDPWGGVNGTDALLILNHFAQISPLTGLKFAAADVNKSTYVNGTDALLVKLRFVGTNTSFPAGDLLYDSDTVIVDGNQVTNNLRMIWFGDVNASYAPMMKNSSSIMLVNEGTISIPSFTEFSLPVKMKYGNEVGAISLGFYYPDQFFEITGVELMNGSPNFSYSLNTGLFRMAWADPTGMLVNDGESLITLKIRSLNMTGYNANLGFSLYENSELADKTGNVIDGVVLELPEIKSFAQGINETPAEFSLSVYPNPFSEHFTVGITLAQESMVKINLYDNFGQKMKTVDQATYSDGTHRIEVGTPNLAPGIYLLQMEITSNEKIWSKTVKVIVSN